MQETPQQQTENSPEYRAFQSMAEFLENVGIVIVPGDRG